MKLSIVLSDYGGVRENFHTPIFLNKQNFNRKDYEIIWVELYGKCQKKVIDYVEAGIIDKAYVMNTPAGGLQKRQLTYNAGLGQSQGDLVCFLDADVVCTVHFIERIMQSFQYDDNIIFFMDEIRHGLAENISYDVNIDNFIFSESACNWINWDYAFKRTHGISHMLHQHVQPYLDRRQIRQDIESKTMDRNYGACMVIKKSDAIAVKGFDESHKFDGLFGGPWEMGWRILNLNRHYREYWHPNEFILHIKHPGTDGTDDKNYVTQFEPGLENLSCHWPGIKMNYHGIKNFLDGKTYPEKACHAFQ